MRGSRPGRRRLWPILVILAKELRPARSHLWHGMVAIAVVAVGLAIVRKEPMRSLSFGLILFISSFLFMKFVEAILEEPRTPLAGQSDDRTRANRNPPRLYMRGRWTKLLLFCLVLLSAFFPFAASFALLLKAFKKIGGVV